MLIRLQPISSVEVRAPRDVHVLVAMDLWSWFPPLKSSKFSSTAFLVGQQTSGIHGRRFKSCVKIVTNFESRTTWCNQYHHSRSQHTIHNVWVISYGPFDIVDYLLRTALNRNRFGASRKVLLFISSPSIFSSKISSMPLKTSWNDKMMISRDRFGRFVIELDCLRGTSKIITSNPALRNTYILKNKRFL